MKERKARHKKPPPVVQPPPPVVDPPRPLPPPPVSVSGRLRTQGNRIVDDSGAPVVLRGANVLRSEWDLRMDAERKGIPALMTWGGNVIVRGFASDPVNNTDGSYLAMLDEHVQLAAANGMQVAFAWRSTSINGPQPLMPGDGAQQALVALARRYRDEPNVMLALQVEPHDVSWATVQPLFQTMVDAIRVESGCIVMVPGIDWGRDVSGAINMPVDRTNVVYKTHPYNASSQFHAQFMTAFEAGLPVFVGEFGFITTGGPVMQMADVTALLDLTKANGIGWAAWCFDFQGGPALVRDNTTWAPTDPYGVAVKAAMPA